MRDGLKVIQVPGSYWAVTLVGWLRRIAGDEYELLPGHRAIGRLRGKRSIGSLASKGPLDDHRLGDPEEGDEEINRMAIRRCKPANEKVWKEHCPKPKGWKVDKDA